MSREREFVKNAFVLALGKFLPQLITFVTLPILTGRLTKAEYGVYDLISTLVLLVIPAATLQIQSAAFRFLIECREDKSRIGEIISDVFAVTVPVSTIAAGIVGACFFKLGSMIRILTGAYLFFDTVSLTLGQIARGLGRNKDFSVQSGIMSFTKMLGIVVGVYLGGKGLAGVLGALVFAEIVSSAYIALRIKVFTYFSLQSISFSKIKELLAYSWPMVPNNLSVWVLSLSDRLVITAALGAEANAVYAVANKIPSMLGIAQSVLAMAWQENASIAAKDDDATDYYSKMLRKTFDLVFGLTALLIAGTPLIFKVLIRGDYLKAYYQIPILILATFFCVMASYMGGIYIAHKKTINIGITTMIAAAVNLIIDVTCVSFIGIWAGSVSTLAAYVFLYFYRLKNCQSFQTINVDFKRQFVQLAIIVLMLIMCFLRVLWLDIFNIVIGFILFFVSNKDIIIKIIKKIKLK